ncbi:MAG: hypothetical protein FJ206_02365 [Gemmatimonadetes bacterium]|nr:hypothetical protein [Gemmatimonadota bacterium]
MTERGRWVTVSVHHDGRVSASTYRIPAIVYRAVFAIAVAGGLLAILAVAVSAPVARAAARVPGLEREIARLAAENQQIGELSNALDQLESNYARLREMVGADLAPDPLRLASSPQVAPAVVVYPDEIAPRYELGPSLPTHWPLDDPGYLTQGQVPIDSADGAHPGVDVALAAGTLVRAAGGATVVAVGSDPEYGLYVRLEHPDTHESMYGHLSRAVVRVGDRVGAGQVVGRSGNTGRSSAPHLHFEIRRGGTSVDPMSVIRKGR